MVNVMQDLKIVRERLDALVPADRNARTHSKKQIRQIADSIRRYGFRNPILCDADGRIVAGHGRAEAARLLGQESVPVIHVRDLTPEQLRAYAIAENKLSELGGWDLEILALEFQELAELDLDFDPTSIGFETAELDLLLAEQDERESVELAPAEPARQKPAVTIVGDLWEIGRHRLICGDAREQAVYERLLDDRRAQMIFTDPPFNVMVNGHVSGLGTAHHPEFPMASGEMSPEAYTQFLASVVTQLAAHSADGSIHFLCMDFRHMAELLAACRGVYTEFKNLCVWAKTNGGMGSLYRSQHELVFVMKAGTAPHINNVELGKHGRYRTNLWRYPGANAFGRNRNADLAMHPTVKPVALVADAIMDCSHRDGIILDAFVGSGTTLLAAERSGRCGYGIELDPWYMDVALERVSAAAGEPARLSGTAMTFEQVRRERQPEAGQ
jgi:DNA modification methylase